MSKYRVSIREVRKDTDDMWRIGYCGLYHPLKTTEPVAYTAGINGWNFDVYKVNGCTICTGYRGMPGKRIDSDLADSYEKRAQEIWENYQLTYEAQTQQVEDLLAEFCEKLRLGKAEEYTRGADNG